MSIVLIMLFISFGTTNYLAQTNNYHLNSQSYLPAKCLFLSAWMSDAKRRRKSSYNKRLIVLSVIFLMFSYLTRVVSIFNPIAEIAKKWLKIIPLGWIRRGYECSSKARKTKQELETWINLFWKAARSLQTLRYIICNVLFDIAKSRLWKICWSSFDSNSCILAKLTYR